MAMRLGDVLRRLREAKGLTQPELARRAKITDEYVSMLESGVRRNPSLEVLQRISKALGLSVGELVQKGSLKMRCFECRTKRQKLVWMERIELKDGVGGVYSQPRCPECGYLPGRGA